MFAQHCRVPFVAERCDVHYPDGRVLTYPELAYRVEEVSHARAAACIGIEDTRPADTVRLLNRMYLRTEQLAGEGQDLLAVEIPPTRHDIIHACDIYEDVGIAHGYNRIAKTVPRTQQIGQQYPLNKLTEQLREQVAQAGFTEALTFTLCSRDDISTKLNRRLEEVPAAHIANPKTLEFQVGRTTLVAGLLKTLAANKKMPLPLKIFEVSDVIVLDEGAEVGARNERRVCAVNCNKAAGFEVVHGLLDRVMQLLEVRWDKADGYCLEACEDATYLPGRCAAIKYRGVVVGKIGVVHPTVLQAFELTNPCSVVELAIEHFV